MKFKRYIPYGLLLGLPSLGLTQAALAQNPAPSPNPVSKVGAASSNSMLTPFRVNIASDAEPRYMRVDTWNALPRITQNGPPPVTEIDGSMIRDTTPTYVPGSVVIGYGGGGPVNNMVPAEGPWAVKCVPDFKGNMTVPGLAKWAISISTWYGKGAYTANTPPDFTTNLNYRWTFDGGTPTGQGQLDVATGQRTVDFNQYVGGGRSGPVGDGLIALDGNYEGEYLTPSTKLSVIASQVDPSNNAPILAASSSYKINWHKGVEIARADPKHLDEKGRRFFAQQGVSQTQNPVIKVNESTYYYQEAQQVTVDYGPELKAATVILGVGAAGAGLLAGGTVGILSGPIGWGVVLVLAAGAGITSVVNGTPPPPVQMPGPKADGGEWAAAVVLQHKIDADTLTNGPLATSSRRIYAPQEVIDDAYDILMTAQQNDPINWNTTWDSSYYFGEEGNFLTATLKCGYLTAIKHQLTDNYDDHGFVESSRSTLNIDKDLFTMLQWTYTGPTRNPVH